MKHRGFLNLAALACALTLLLAAGPAAQAAGFRDVPASHWAYQAIMDAADSGLTAGYADGGFHPGDDVTYAQFTAFLARAFYASPIQSSSSPWYQIYLDAVKEDGVLDGTAAAGGRAESLGKPISRYDMALMMYHVMSARGGLPGGDERKAAGAKLADWDRIPGQYQDAVSSCAAAGLLNGMGDGTFSGSKNMNRAQACAVIARMREKLGGAAPAREVSLPEARSELLRLMNAERTQKSVKALAASSALDKAAQALVGEVFQGYYETRPDGRSWATAIVDAGFPVDDQSSAVQFPVYGCATAAAVMQNMKGKSDVMTDLLDGTYTHVGVGYLKSVGDEKDCWSILLVREARTSQSGPSSPEDLGAELMSLINAQRAKSNLKPLASLDSLTKAAQMRAKDLSGGYFDFRPDGGDWASVLNVTGVSASFVDESYVVGYRTAADALTLMLNTQSAKEALSNPEFTHVGVGYVHDANGYEGYQDFWSILYITQSGASSPAPAPSGGGSGETLSYTPVPMKDLANRKSLQKKATDDQLAQAYAEAAKLVEPFAGLPLEQKLEGICKAVRDRFDNGMSYSMETDHYNDPYGYFIQGSASCAGCTRATGLCLNILGIPYEHVHENQYTHQWCRVNVNGTYWICDPYGLYCGPEPVPYVHANPLLN